MIPSKKSGEKRPLIDENRAMNENSKKRLRKITKKGEPGKTHPSLEEPRRIIYTYQRGSYKVELAV
jgi:hypothetical protein